MRRRAAPRPHPTFTAHDDDLPRSLSSPRRPHMANGSRTRRTRYARPAPVSRRTKILTRRRTTHTGLGLRPLDARYAERRRHTAQQRHSHHAEGNTTGLAGRTMRPRAHPRAESAATDASMTFGPCALRFHFGFLQTAVAVGSAGTAPHAQRSASTTRMRGGRQGRGGCVDGRRAHTHDCVLSFFFLCPHTGTQAHTRPALPCPAPTALTIACCHSDTHTVRRHSHASTPAHPHTRTRTHARTPTPAQPRTPHPWHMQDTSDVPDSPPAHFARKPCRRNDLQGDGTACIGGGAQGEKTDIERGLRRAWGRAHGELRCPRRRTQAARRCATLPFSRSVRSFVPHATSQCVHCAVPRNTQDLRSLRANPGARTPRAGRHCACSSGRQHGSCGTRVQQTRHRGAEDIVHGSDHFTCKIIDISGDIWFHD